MLGSGLIKLKTLRNEGLANEPIALESQSMLKNMGISYSVIKSPKEIGSVVDQLLKENTAFGLDIETYPLREFVQDTDGGIAPRKSAIRLIQIYDGKAHVYVFDLKKIGSISQIPTALWERPLIAHNALFEMKHLLHSGIVLKKLGCSLLADRVINGNRTRLKKECGLLSSASLKNLSKEMLGLDIDKEMQTSDWSEDTLTEIQIEYAALDAVLPIKLFQKQREVLSKKRLIKSYELLRDAQLAIAYMENSGIGFDISNHRELIEDLKKKSEVLLLEIYELLGVSFNLNSSKQFGEWLSDILDENELARWVKTNSGKLSTSTPTLKQNENRHEAFAKIVQYRQLTKRISSFGEGLYKFIDIPSKRLFGSFSLGTTSTGRMASRQPNMQNMPRSDFRQLFIPKEGYRLISLDYSQQELRVAALITQDKALLHIYEAGGDVHANTAAALLNIPKESVSKPQRQLAKAVIFGLLYGQGAKGLANYAKQQYGVDMTEEEAERHRGALFRTYQGLRAWQKQTGSLAKLTGTASTPSGRIRDFRRELEGYKFTAALNLPIQGAAAEITLRAMIRFTPFLSEECHLVNVIHDELLLEVIESQTSTYASLAQEAMEKAFLDIFPNAKTYLKGLVEANIGQNWGELK